MDDVVYGSFEATASSIAPAASDPDSVGLTANGWSTMTPSPGAQNINQEQEVTIASYETTDDTDSDSETNLGNGSVESTTEAAETKDEQTTQGEQDEPTVPFVSLGDIRDVELGSEVITEGVVSALPGVLGKQYFYIAGSGIRVYLHSAEFPSLDLGMRLRLQGVLSQAAGERRLKLPSPEAIVKLGVEDAPVPHDVTSSLVGEATEGWLVRITGTVSSKTGDNYTLTDTDGDTRMTIKNSTEIIPSFSVGDEITVVGIVGQTSAGHRILPRNQNDILIRTDEDSSDSATAAGMIIEHSDTTGGIAWALSGIMVALAIALFTVHRLKKRKTLINQPKLSI